MSIRDEVNGRMAEGRLFLLNPLLTSDPVCRTMFVTREIYEIVSPPFEHTAEGRSFGQLRANLDAFVQGLEISMANDPYNKKKSAYIARTDPIEDEIWDIRSRDPKPALRVLGAFAEADVFVALTYEFRKNLGDPQSRQWRDFILRAKAEWRNLFQTYKPHKGKDLHDYVTENFFAV